MSPSILQAIKAFIISISIAFMSANPGATPSATISGVPQTELAPNADVSQNWAGYEADGGNFTSVSGTWTIPTINQNTQGADAMWVGIGGANTRDLIQSGTQEIADPASGVIYEAWVETLPQESQPIPVSVNGGDSVTVSLALKSGNTWQLTFTDNTNKQYYQTNLTYKSSLSSAEWIEETPSTGRRFLPLDNFGSITITKATATKDGKVQDLSQLNAKPIQMSGQFDQLLAAPSKLNSDGASFTVTANQQTDTTTPSSGYSNNISPRTEILIVPNNRRSTRVGRSYRSSRSVYQQFNF